MTKSRGGASVLSGDGQGDQTDGSNAYRGGHRGFFELIPLSKRNGPLEGGDTPPIFDCNFPQC